MQIWSLLAKSVGSDPQLKVKKEIPGWPEDESDPWQKFENTVEFGLQSRELLFFHPCIFMIQMAMIIIMMMTIDILVHT